MKKKALIWLVIAVIACLILIMVTPGIHDAVFHHFTHEPYRNGRSLQGWIEQLQDADPDARREAISNIGAMGAKAAAAIPKLNELAWKDHISVRAWAICDGLGPIGPEALPSLQRLLKDRSVRTVTVIAIGNMGPQAKSAIADLIDILGDNFSRTRVMACNALGKMGPAAKEAVPALVRALKDPADGVRIEAAEALRRIDPTVAAKQRSP
jgi:HEAT repeat protein